MVFRKLLVLVTSACLGPALSFVVLSPEPVARVGKGVHEVGHRPWLCQRSPRPVSMYIGDVSIIDAIDRAAVILAESSRGGAVVEQIPYVPAENVVDFDKIVLGSAACLLAYAWAAFEFGKRIVTQRACEVCEGSGLVRSSRSGKRLSTPMKCYACGGFLPWENWGRFWQSNMDVGNGGVLQRPASDYDELNEAARAAKERRSDAGSDG